MNDPGDPPRRGRRRTGGSLDQWMTAGRQLVDGVAGARPGSRPQGRPTGGRAGGRPGLEGLGRWVENRIDWFLEGEDDWPEPWQERQQRSKRQDRPENGPGPLPSGRRSPQAPQPSAAPLPQAGAQGSPEQRPRRSLEAISRRAAPLLPPAPESRVDPSRVTPPAATGNRPLPRSSRRPR